MNQMIFFKLLAPAIEHKNGGDLIQLLGCGVGCRQHVMQQQFLIQLRC